MMMERKPNWRSKTMIRKKNDLRPFTEMATCRRLLSHNPICLLSARRTWSRKRLTWSRQRLTLELCCLRRLLKNQMADPLIVTFMTSLICPKTTNFFQMKKKIRKEIIWTYEFNLYPPSTMLLYLYFQIKEKIRRQ